MKILILNWRDIRHHHRGGAEVATFQHAKAWVKAGHLVVWFSSASRNGKKEEKIAGIQIIRRGYEIGGVYLAAFWWYLTNGRGQFDLIIDQFHGFPFFSPLYIRAKKLAFIHEVTKEVWLLNPLVKPLDKIVGYFGYFLEPFIFKLYRRIPFMTVSDSTRKDLIEFGVSEQNITVVHNGIEVKPPKPFPQKEKKPTLIFLGALAEDKGIEDAIRSFGVIRKNIMDWQFWVVGGSDPNYLKRLKQLAGGLDLGNQIKFWGYVSDEKRFELLARAHLLVNPSTREGWGLVVIEANRMKTPVVGYDSPGLRDSIVDQKTGWLCRSNTPQEMANHAIKIIENKKLYRRLQKTAYEWSLKFNWPTSTEQSLKLIEDLANNKLPRPKRPGFSPVDEKQFVSLK